MKPRRDLRRLKRSPLTAKGWAVVTVFALTGLAGFALALATWCDYLEPMAQEPLVEWQRLEP